MRKFGLVIGLLLYSSIASAQTTYSLAWDASTSPGVQGYYLYVGSQPGSYSQQIDAGNGTTWQLTLNPGTHYLVVRAYAGTGLSAPTNELTIAVPTTDTQAPTAPNSISAAAASTSQVNVAWSASTDNVAVSQYRVERCAGSSCTGFAQIATPAGASYSDSGLTASTTYRYRVRAADAAGNLSAYSAIANATTVSAADTQAPTAPTGISATAASTTQINVAWGASSDNVAVTQYRVERCVGSACTAFAQIGTPSAASYGDSGLTAATTYRYRVRAADAAGNLSPYSAITSATTGATPVNQCVAVPLSVTVTRWPTNSGGKNLRYTSSQPIANGGIQFTNAGRTITSITFTDTRGCTATVNR